MFWAISRKKGLFLGEGPIKKRGRALVQKTNRSEGDCLQFNKKRNKIWRGGGITGYHFSAGDDLRGGGMGDFCLGERSPKRFLMVTIEGRKKCCYGTSQGVRPVGNT